MSDNRFPRASLHTRWLGLGCLLALWMAAPLHAGTLDSKKKVSGAARVAVAASASGAIGTKRPVNAPRDSRSSSASSSRKQAVAVQQASVVRVSAPAQRVSVAQQLGLKGADDPLRLDSSVALVIDQETQEVLFSKNDDAVLPIASLTKLMTGLLVADADLALDQEITITGADVDRLKNSGSRLPVGARLTRGEALHLALMSSENRAAHALGRTYPGGLSAFVRLMNQKAAELGMKDTRFVEPTGLSSENRSSARDLALLVAAAYERPLLRDLSTSSSYDVALGRRQVLQYRNSNRLIDRPDWEIGLQKTGYIAEAGRCLAMQLNVAGRQLIMVLLDARGPAARAGDAERVRRWLESSVQETGVEAGLQG
jgi:serine-type D-Ala-D-Ala endopeptidase (penicillin-binding protein 7)